MFWIGLIVGMFIATAAIVAYLALSCHLVYGTMETFNSMVKVTMAAAENRRSEVVVYHDGNALDTAVFEEL